MGEMGGIGDLIDLDRYSIADPEDPGGKAAIAEGRERFAGTGLCLLPGFLRPAGIERLAAEAATLVPKAHRLDHVDIAYGRYRARLDEFPPGHAVRRTSRFRMGLVSYDEIPEGGSIRAVYHWDGLTRLVAGLTGSASLFRTADPLLSCNVSVLGPGDSHGWHYDGNDFVVTLLLQAAEEGGHFEFVPNIARADDENFAAVSRVYDGDRAGVVRPPLEPGTLCLFRGRYSIHRVSLVTGARPRLLAVFSYHVEPGLVFPAATQRNYVGRASAVA